MSRARYASLYERLVANTSCECDGGCWLWTGKVEANGRPRMNIRREGRHRSVNPAREMLNLFYVLDSETEASHLCTTSYLCINPDHLVPETKQQNMARRWGKPVPEGRVWAPRVAVDPEPWGFAIDGDGNNREDVTGLLLTAPAIAPTLHPCAELFGAMEIAG